MKMITSWNNQLNFSIKSKDHTVIVDTKPPLGSNLGPSPKELLLGAIAACSGMDVASLLRKHRQTVDEFSISTEGDLTENYPAIFKNIQLSFYVKGNIDPAIFCNAIHQSQTKYCGVSAMVHPTSPISWRAFVNDIEVGKGEADFKIEKS